VAAGEKNVPNWRGIQRGNFSDSRIRRNWNKLATLITEMFSKTEFKFGTNGEVQIKGGLPQKWNAYDNAGAFVVPNVPGTVPFDVQRLNSNTAIFTAFSNGELSINGDGNPFTFIATVTAQHVGSVETNWLCRVWLEENTGSSWTEVPGSSVNFGSRE